jgi:hypothetical protein
VIGGRRIRLTTHSPLGGEHIGLTVWFGSIDNGWIGWPVFKRGMVWAITSGPFPDRASEPER